MGESHLVRDRKRGKWKWELGETLRLALLREGGGRKTRRVGDRTDVAGIPCQIFCESEQCKGKKIKEGGWASKGRDLKVERQEEIQRYYYDITFSQSLNVFLDTTYQEIL